MQDILSSALRGFFYVIQVWLFFFWLYWMVISLFGFKNPRPMKDYPPTKRFLILVPAHNEEKVIKNLVENLLHLDYPRELYDIYVIADNCTDRTAEISRQAGAKVIEHYSKPGEPRGKPYALKYAFEVLDDQLDNYDAFCVFDADNLVSLNYLREMNKNLMNGDKLIQCYLDTKNPDDNWISTSYAATYYYMNRSWQLAKANLGLGNAVGGTGFCVAIEVLRKVGWKARSLTEDLEFQMQCLLEGIPARWNHYARVYDEKPTDFIASVIQRLRWARGHWDVCIHYSWPLLKRAIFKRDLLAFDGLVYLLNPGKIVISTITAILLGLGLVEEVKWFKAIIPPWAWAAVLAFQFLYLAYCMIMDAKKKIASVIKGMVCLPIFNYTYIPLFFWALLTHKNKTWKRTEHVRGISIKDLEN